METKFSLWESAPDWFNHAKWWEVTERWFNAEDVGELWVLVQHQTLRFWSLGKFSINSKVTFSFFWWNKRVKWQMTTITWNHGMLHQFYIRHHSKTTRNYNLKGSFFLKNSTIHLSNSGLPFDSCYWKLVQKCVRELDAPAVSGKSYRQMFLASTLHGRHRWPC